LPSRTNVRLFFIDDTILRCKNHENPIKQSKTLLLLLLGAAKIGGFFAAGWLSSRLAVAGVLIIRLIIAFVKSIVQA
jgi:hypothetical protein